MIANMRVAGDLKRLDIHVTAMDIQRFKCSEPSPEPALYLNNIVWSSQSFLKQLLLASVYGSAVFADGLPPLNARNLQEQWWPI